MINRIKAACSAFRDPWLVQEAKDLRKEASDLNVNNEFALLFGIDDGNWVVPLVKRLKRQDRLNIKRVLSSKMIFDLFDAMGAMKEAFGQDGQILLTQDEEGIKIRLMVLDSEIYNREFMVTRLEMIGDSGVDLLNVQFRDSIEILKRRHDNKEKETAKCRDCDWMIIHPNDSMGCLQANHSIPIEIEMIKAALSSGKCDDFRKAKHIGRLHEKRG